MEKIEGYHYLTNEYVEVQYENGKIKSIISRENILNESRNEQVIAPALFDLQVNGFGGVDFNSLSTTPEDILAITKQLNEKGTLKFLPTVITNSFDNIMMLLQTIRKAVDTYEECKTSILGVHLEGPFLSKEDGPRGAHPLEAVCPPNIEMIKAWQEASKDIIKIITLSPEYDTAEDVITYCCSKGIKVSIGHTAANRQQILRAIDAGATLSTHLGNGSHTVVPRHDNYIWNQLADERLNCSLIGDGVHLPNDVLKCFLAIKKEKAILISDSSEIAGLAPGKYETHIGGKVILTKEKRLCVAEHPELLAGSVATLFDEINHLIHDNIASLKDSILMAAVRPSRFMDMNNNIIVGNSANLITIKKVHNELCIGKVIKEGNIVKSY